MPLGLFDRNKVVLWPGCEGRARCNLHKRNMRSVRFVVKRRGCCCNLPGGVALNVRFTTYGMRAKNNTVYTWREQAIIEWSRRVISIVVCCHSLKLCAHAARPFRSQHLEWNKFRVLLQISFCYFYTSDCVWKSLLVGNTH